jgi:hypothetical protein
MRPLKPTVRHKNIGLLMSKPATYGDRFPIPGDICVICDMQIVKRAALAFDRVYIPSYVEYRSHGDPPPELSFGVSEADSLALKNAKIEKQLKVNANVESKSRSAEGVLLKVNYSLPLRTLVSAYVKSGITTTPFFPSEPQLSSEYGIGASAACMAVFEHIPTVIDSESTWEQIIEFRKDVDAIRKYRDFRFWYKDALHSISPREAAELIGKKVDDYEWAIKKHGLITKVGAVKQLFRIKTGVPIAAAFGISHSAAGPIWGALSAGLMLTAQITLHVAERFVDLEDLRRGPGSEVALVSEIRSRFDRNP